MKLDLFTKTALVIITVMIAFNTPNTPLHAITFPVKLIIQAAITATTLGYIYNRELNEENQSTND